MKNRSLIILFILFIIISLPSTSLGRSMIRGQVVDAETGKPIEGAAVYIYWGKRGEGPPGLAADSVKVEIAEDLTDSGGFFNIPKYSIFSKHYYLDVYKKGFVCWSSEWIFPTWEKRKDFKLKNGMIIKLERFKKEYSKEEHARFTVFSQVGASPPNSIFDEAIEHERELKQNMHKKGREN